MAFIQLQLRGLPIRVYQAESEEEANSGLLGMLLQDDEGFMLPASNGIHTMGMAAPIDIVWLDQNGVTLAVDESVMPGQVVEAKGPFAVELMGGWFARHPACSCAAPGACACTDGGAGAQFVGQNYMERPGPMGMHPAGYSQGARGPGPMSRGGHGGHRVRGDVQFAGAPRGGGGGGGGHAGPGGRGAGPHAHAGPGAHAFGGGGGPHAHVGPGPGPGPHGHHGGGHGGHGHGHGHGHHHGHHDHGRDFFFGGVWGGWGGWPWWDWGYDCDPRNPDCPNYDPTLDWNWTLAYENGQ